MEYCDRKECSNRHAGFEPLPSKQNAANMTGWRNLERRNLQIRLYRYLSPPSCSESELYSSSRDRSMFNCHMTYRKPPTIHDWLSVTHLHRARMDVPRFYEGTHAVKRSISVLHATTRALHVARKQNTARFLGHQVWGKRDRWPPSYICKFQQYCRREFFWHQRWIG